LQNITNNLPEAFTNYKGVTNHTTLLVNVPERVEIPTQNLPNQNKRGLSVVTKDKTPKQDCQTGAHGTIHVAHFF
jgi:hypothetical protein